MANVTGISSDGASSNNSSVPGSYFALEEFSGYMATHITLMTIAWFFVLPIGVMLSIARSRYSFISQVIFLVANALGLIVAIIYDSRTPDLYEDNSHHKFGWAVTWIAIVHAILSAVSRRASEATGQKYNTEREQSQSLYHHDLLQHYQKIHHFEDGSLDRYSHDSGHGTDASTTRSGSLLPTNNGISTTEGKETDHMLEGHSQEEVIPESHWWLSNDRAYSFVARHTAWTQGSRVGVLVRVLNMVIERTILILGFVVFATGLVTYAGVFRSNVVFNGLAHFIKGGVFYWYGLFCLGRCMGAFADLGWAWNTKPGAEIVGWKKAAIPSAEFVESFLIFFYGATNFFLEHLAAWGGAWTAQDLEHVSISIMFFGGGLCGMLIESKRIRDVLNSACRTPLSSLDRSMSLELFQPPRTYDFSMNPIPGLIILLLGLTMSSHHQHSMVSTMIHKQWGMLFTGAALARGFTYSLIYLSPPTSLLPSRPPTELIVSFCLISGGMIFMASNKDTVAAMETYDLNAMFVFTVTMGLTAFIMAWTIVTLAVKGWAIKVEEKKRF
ncbi:hypothetical protein MMC25_002269 [Agyrium rufum]|nr:hypothetical protein [Agyrium rufum]